MLNSEEMESQSLSNISPVEDALAAHLHPKISLYSPESALTSRAGCFQHRLMGKGYSYSIGPLPQHHFIPDVISGPTKIEDDGFTRSCILGGCRHCHWSLSPPGQGVIQDEIAGYPRSRLWTVSLPVDQELEPSSADIQDAPDCVGGPPSTTKGGRGQTEGSDSATGLTLETWNAGCILNAGGSFGQAASGFTFCSTSKGQSEARFQVPRFHLEWESLCGQPDLLTWLIGRSWSPAPIGLTLRALGGPQECGVNLPPHPPALAYVGRYPGHCHLVLQELEQQGLVGGLSLGTHGAGRYVVPGVG